MRKRRGGMHPEDLVKGTYVTILHGASVTIVQPFVRYQTTNITLNGAIFRVLAYSAPYVAVEVLYNHGGMPNGTKFDLDTRDVVFTRVTDEYVSALARVEIKRPNPFQRAAAEEKAMREARPPSAYLREPSETGKGGVATAGDETCSICHSCGGLHYRFCPYFRNP